MSALHWEARRKQFSINKSNNIKLKWQENLQINEKKQGL